LQESFTPTSSIAPYAIDPLASFSSSKNSAKKQQSLSTSSSLLHHKSSSGSLEHPTSSASASPVATSSQVTSAHAVPSPASKGSALANKALPPGPKAIQGSGSSDRDNKRAKDAAYSAAKSFRVTLEDPCWKVLPAVLKKYKVDDDWKRYALFITFGNTGKYSYLQHRPLTNQKQSDV
jgi:hypothetical protein